VRSRVFGALGEVSATSFGGGGIGGRFGPTRTRSALATIECAVAARINLIDVAPSYGTDSHPREAERLIGEAFAGL
jgi:aryl-alcohol dehydrogenase-like predicted oxidoreductase